MSSLTPKPQFMIPFFPLPSPGDSSDPTGFSSDAAINEMSSPGRPQPPTAAKPAWKSLCRNQIKPEPVQTNRFDSVCLQDVQGNKQHAKRHHGGLISKIQTLQNSIGHIIWFIQQIIHWKMKRIRRDLRDESTRHNVWILFRS